jgi:hypothetical protein
MYKTKQRERRVRTDICEGKVCTSFQHVSLETISGICFSCHLESDAGAQRCDYILRTRDIEELEVAAAEGGEGWYSYYGEDGEPTPADYRPLPIRDLVGSHRFN